MMKRILEFKKSSSYHHRIMFLKLCDTALSTFSNRYFKENFFNDYMDMSRDPVSNIRLKFLTLVPRVRKCFVLPKDSNLLYRLTDTIGSLMTSEPCYDVSTSAKSNLRFMKSDSSESDNPGNKMKEEEEDLISKICGEAAKEANKSGASKITKGTSKVVAAVKCVVPPASIIVPDTKSGSMNSLLSDRATSASRKSSANPKVPDSAKKSITQQVDSKKIPLPQTDIASKRLSSSSTPGPSTPVKSITTKISASLPVSVAAIKIKPNTIPNIPVSVAKSAVSTAPPVKLASAASTVKPIQPSFPSSVPNIVKKPTVVKKI